MSNNNKKQYSDRFIKFLIAFGVKGLSEYLTFSEEEKLICKREYFKWLRSN